MSSSGSVCRPPPLYQQSGGRQPPVCEHDCSDVAYENLETVVKDTKAMEVGSDDGLAMLPMLP